MVMVYWWWWWWPILSTNKIWSHMFSLECACVICSLSQKPHIRVNLVIHNKTGCKSWSSEVWNLFNGCQIMMWSGLVSFGEPTWEVIYTPWLVASFWPSISSLLSNPSGAPYMRALMTTFWGHQLSSSACCPKPNHIHCAALSCKATGSGDSSRRF